MAAPGNQGSLAEETTGKGESRAGAEILQGHLGLKDPRGAGCGRRPELTGRTTGDLDAPPTQRRPLGGFQPRAGGSGVCFTEISLAAEFSADPGGARKAAGGPSRRRGDFCRLQAAGGVRESRSGQWAREITTESVDGLDWGGGGQGEERRLTLRISV